ncbi:MAG: alpha-amylase family glycosyl hydrolase [Candidatus Saccharimonadales bacterium]
MAHQVKKNLGAILRRGGVEFRVWAPFAQGVAVATPFVGHDLSNQVAMQSENDGYWSVFIDGAEAGQTYKYLIDTGSEILHRNDPRARALTSSENGDSIIVANDFDWGDDLFMPIPREEHIIYEMHIGTFNRPDAATQGTFDDAIEKLDYLVDLGINMIELMPVTSLAFSQGWGYNVRDIFSIENSYGGRHGLMTFVRACHERGIGVIADVVYNHFMSETLWQFDGWRQNDDSGGIYFYGDDRGHTPWGARPDYGRPEVKQFILDNVVMWLNEFRLDGLRLDSTSYLRNKAGSEDLSQDIAEAWTLLGDITTLGHKVRPGSILIAEDTSSNTYITRSTHDGGAGFDAQWALPFPNAIRWAFGLEAPYPANMIEQIMYKYNGDAWQRVIFSDSHDTAANGHVRLNAAVSPTDAGSLLARQQTLIASALALTAPGIPLLLQGQEFMQEGAFNDWKELEWDKAERFAGIVQAHRDLIDLRLNRRGTTRGLLGQSVAIFHNNPANHVIGYHRWDQGGPRDDVLVLVNFSDQHFDSYDVVLPRTGNWQVRFNSSWRGYNEEFHEILIDSLQTDESNRASLSLPRRSVLIFSQD